MKRVSKQHAKQASYSIWRYEDQKAILFEKEGGGGVMILYTPKRYWTNSKQKQINNL